MLGREPSGSGKSPSWTKTSWVSGNSVGIPTRPTLGRTTGFRAEIPPNKVDGSGFVSFSVVSFVTFLLRPKDNDETTLPILGQTGLELPIGRPFGLVGRFGHRWWRYLVGRRQLGDSGNGVGSRRLADSFSLGLLGPSGFLIAAPRVFHSGGFILRKPDSDRDRDSDRRFHRGSSEQVCNGPRRFLAAVLPHNSIEWVIGP